MPSSPGQRAKIGPSSSLGTAGELTFFIAGTADELRLLRDRDSKLVRSPSSVLTQAGAGSVNGLTTPPVFRCCSARGEGRGVPSVLAVALASCPTCLFLSPHCCRSPVFSGGEGREWVWVIEVASLRWEPGVLGAIDGTEMGWVVGCPW